MFEQAVSLTFIFQTIAVILVVTAICIVYVKLKSKKKEDYNNDAI